MESSIGIKSVKVNQSKIPFKNDDAIQFKLKKMQILLRISALVYLGNIVRNLSVALNKFNNNLTKQYYMNIEKSSERFNKTLNRL